MRAQIKKAIENKDQDNFKTLLEQYVGEMTQGMTQWEISQLIQEIRFQHPGKKGRLSSPFTEEKVKESTGKRGRPSLTVEEKLARIEEKLKREKEKILEETKYRELSEEEIKEQYA